MKLLSYYSHTVRRQTNGRFILLAGLHMKEQLKSSCQLVLYQTVNHALEN